MPFGVLKTELGAKNTLFTVAAKKTPWLYRETRLHELAHHRCSPRADLYLAKRTSAIKIRPKRESKAEVFCLD
jgi:hypothetical protein